MITAFLDMNILLDYILNRQPFAKEALSIIELAERGMIEAAVSSASIYAATYFIRKVHSPARSVKIIADLIRIVSALPTDAHMIGRALTKHHLDLEDAYQYETALSYPLTDYFVTRNIKDFRRLETSLPVIVPGDFLLKVTL